MSREYITGKLSTDLDIGFSISATVNGKPIQLRKYWGYRIEEVIANFLKMYEIKDTDKVQIDIKSIDK